MIRGYDVYKSNLIGNIYMIVNELGVEEIFLMESHFQDYLLNHSGLKRDKLLCQKTKQQITDYFEGRRRNFDLPLDIKGTSFRKQVWQALQTIPYGATVSYKEIAHKVGNPKGARAVGGAVKANPLPIVIPCHRVIGADGQLTGFMGSHTDVKAKLLAHEEKVYHKQK